MAAAAETAKNRVGEKMHLSDVDGQIIYDLAEFCEDYGHPQGQLFTFEVTCDAVTYVYARVLGSYALERLFSSLVVKTWCARERLIEWRRTAS